MNRLLVQCQLSNYDRSGQFILEADSGWQMVMGRVRTMLQLDPTLTIDVMMPCESQVLHNPVEINRDLVWNNPRLRFIEHHVIPNALTTRFDFDWQHVSHRLDLARHRGDPGLQYTHVYVNDPMHLRNFKAMFFVVGGYQPKFLVHSHFIDNPECPKFPVDGSLWMGQVEAARRADFNFWQCESAMNVFFDSMSKEYLPEIVEQVKAKSAPWDDGYSTDEINVVPDLKNLRFDPRELDKIVAGKVVVFVPNRVGGQGRSSDYTNCGKFLFEHCNALWEKRQDFVVFAGNPSQKFSNDEIGQLCKPYQKLVPDAFNRDEYRYVASKSHVAVGLYDQDSYGGTAARELIDLNCYPLWIDRYEYSKIAKLTNYPYVASGFDTLDATACELFDFVKRTCHEGTFTRVLEPLRKCVKKRCSYESTTPTAMKLAGML